MKVVISTGDKLADKYDDGHYLDQDVVVDGKFISAKGLVEFWICLYGGSPFIATIQKKVDWQESYLFQTLAVRLSQIAKLISINDIKGLTPFYNY